LFRYFNEIPLDANLDFKSIFGGGAQGSTWDGNLSYAVRVIKVKLIAWKYNQALANFVAMIPSGSLLKMIWPIPSMMDIQ
jgi:hypothetical protein